MAKSKRVAVVGWGIIVLLVLMPFGLFFLDFGAVAVIPALVMYPAAESMVTADYMAATTVACRALDDAKDVLMTDPSVESDHIIPIVMAGLNYCSEDLPSEGPLLSQAHAKARKSCSFLLAMKKNSKSPKLLEIANYALIACEERTDFP